MRSRERSAKQRGEQFVRLLQLSDHDAPLEKHRRGHDENRRIDEECRIERDCGVDGVESARLAFSFIRWIVGARLHQRGVEIEVVGHDRRADDAYGNVQTPFRKGRAESLNDLPPLRRRYKDLEDKAQANDGNQEQDKALEFSHPEILNREEQHGVERGNNDAHQEGQPEEQIESYGGSEDLGQIARGDRDFCQDPEKVCNRSRVVVSAGLGEVPTRHDAKPRGQGLEKKGHHVGRQQDPQQLIPETGAGFEISRPVARVHVPYAYEVRWAKEREHALQDVGALWYGNAPMYF